MMNEDQTPKQQHEATTPRQQKAGEKYRPEHILTSPGAFSPSTSAAVVVAQESPKKNSRYVPPDPEKIPKKKWGTRQNLTVAIVVLVITIIAVIAGVPRSLFTFGKRTSTQTFTFASINKLSSADLKSFAAFTSSITNTPPKCITNATLKDSLGFNGTDLNVSLIIITFSCKTYSSNEFRERALARLALGRFAGFGIIGFGEGLQIPKDFCGSQHYGISCTACASNCQNPLTCDAGTLGTGKCRCSSDFIGPVKSGFAPGSTLAEIGRCWMLSSSAVDFGKVNVGGTRTSTILLYNVGNRSSTIQTVYIEAVPSDDGSTVSQSLFFSIVSQPSFPLTISPGGSFNLTLSFAPTTWGLASAYLGIYVHDSNSIPPDDVIQAVDLSGAGAIGGVVPSGDVLQGNLPIYVMDCGSANGFSNWNELDWEVDAYFTGGTAVSTSVYPNSVLNTYRLLDSNIIPGYTNGYQFPILYAGNLTISMYFADPNSNATGQRVFDVVINGQVVENKLDIYAKTSGAGFYTSVYKLANGGKTLSIDFQPIKGIPLVNAISVYQNLNIKLNKSGNSNEMNYGQALLKNYLFYEAQKSGKMGQDSRLAWRSDSCMDCNGTFGEDLSGGYYEAGNYLKLNFPMCWSLTSMAWGMLMTPNGHAAAQQTSAGMDSIKWGTDYLLESHPNPTAFVLSLGTSYFDFRYWGPPETYRTFVPKREIWYVGIGTNNRSTETTSECAASLASASILYKTSDPAYAASLLAAAKSLFDMGYKYQGSHMDSTNAGFVQMQQLYASYSYLDEISWGAAWLYKATGDDAYLQIARDYYDLYIQTAQCGWAYSWEEKGPGLSVLLSSIDPDKTMQAKYDKYAKCHLDMWLPGPKRTVPVTPRGLSFRLNWGACRFAVNTAFLSFAYQSSLNQRALLPDYQKSLYEYGKFQVDYMLGKFGRSYVAGHGLLFSKYIWHKSSYNSILYWPVKWYNNSFQSWEYKASLRPQTHILYGALVGGPIAVNGEATDFFLDNRASYVYTEVTIDYNAALGGAIAYLIEREGAGPLVTDGDLDLGYNFKRPSGYEYDTELQGPPSKTTPPTTTPPVIPTTAPVSQDNTTVQSTTP